MMFLQISLTHKIPHIEQQCDVALLGTTLTKHSYMYHMDMFKHCDKSYNLFTKVGMIVIPKMLQRRPSSAIINYSCTPVRTIQNSPSDSISP